MDKTSLPSAQLCNSITLFRPNRPVLVTTCNRDGTVHVAPFAWCVPASYNPPMVSLALLSNPRKQHSLVNIERDREFVVNLPGYDVSPDLVRASYRYPAGVYKAGILGLEFSPAQRVDVPLVKQCRAHVECRLKTSIVTGDHTLLVADVVDASYASEQYHEGFIIDVENYPPCLHLGHVALPDGQTHTFIDGGEGRPIHVPFNLPGAEPGASDDSHPVGPRVQPDDVTQGRSNGKVKATVFATGFACPDGPCWDEEGGDLFVVDWAVGVVRRVTPEGRVTDFIDTGGMPAGACCAPDGHLYVCDTGRKQVLDITRDGVIRVAASSYQGKRFLGPTDCVSDANGVLYFSDADGFNPRRPCGSVYLLRPDGRVELFAAGFAFPSGLSISADGAFLFLSETFARRIHRFTLDERGHAREQCVFAELDGGIGPNGLALDEEKNLCVAHFGKGVVAVLDQGGQILAELPTQGFLPTNVTLWNGSLYVTELERGYVMRLDEVS
jgi:gluconolactonase